MASWYILLYHNVSWEHGPFAEFCTSCCPPSLFREHVSAVANSYRIVSLEEGWRLTSSGTLTEDIVTFWFDDGLRGVREYACPILKEFDAVGALSVCSSFWRKKRHFWRFQLGYLQRIDGMRFLRTKLRPLGFKMKDSIKSFTLDHFSPEVLEAINQTFVRLSDEAVQRASFNLFDDAKGLKELAEAGWMLTNHSQCHLPIGEPRGIHEMKDQFEGCDVAMLEDLGVSNRYLVLPFSRMTKNAEDLNDRFKKSFPERCLVFAGNTRNKKSNLIGGRIYRHTAPIASGEELLRSLSYAGGRGLYRR